MGERSGDSVTRTFSTLQAFGRAINHALRTPLAVISNDLYYLAAHDQTGVAHTTAEQCRKIAVILEPIAALGSTPIAFEALSVDAILGLLPRMRTAAGGIQLTSESRFTIERARFAALVRLCSALLEAEGDVEISAAIHRSTLKITFAGAAHAAAPAFQERDGMPVAVWPDRLEAPLIEALTELHSGWFEDISTRQISIVLPEIPR